MAEKYDMGTPLGGERDLKQRLRDVRQRMSSPSADMDTSANATASNVTLESIAALLDKKFDEKLTPMTLKVDELQAGFETIKEDMSTLKAVTEEKDAMLQSNVDHITAGLAACNIEVEHAKGEIQRTKEQLNHNIETINVRLKILEGMKVDARPSGHDQQANAQIKSLEEQIKKLSSARCASQASFEELQVTAVIGGLQGHGSLAEADQWVRDQLWHSWSPSPTEVYAKGDFKGILFCKFPSTVEADVAVKHFKSTKYNVGGHSVWAKPDAPLLQRVVQSALFGAKHLMGQWGEPRSSMWIDLEESALYWKDEMALKVQVAGQTLNIENGPEWGAYFKAKEWDDIIGVQEAKLKQNVKGKGGGKSTGKAGR